jgi:hypothetical protein
MATNLSSHNPIKMTETISGNTALTDNPPQKSGQTFALGSPISRVGGFAQQWDGSTLSGLPGSIYGVSQEAGGNLATSGEGYPANFGQQGPPWSTYSIGAPPNQPNAVTIPYGAPFLSGGVLTMVAVGDTLFIAQYDTAEAATSITAGSVASTGIASLTATNTHYVGEQVVFSGFASGGLPINGLTGIVLTASGSAYTAQLSVNPGTIATLGAGTDNPTYAPTLQTVGLQFGLTQDASGTWYIDGAKTTVGTNTCIKIYSLYAGDVLQTNPFVEVPNGMLVFQFVSTVVNI